MKRSDGTEGGQTDVELVDVFKEAPDGTRRLVGQTRVSKVPQTARTVRVQVEAVPREGRTIRVQVEAVPREVQTIRVGRVNVKGEVIE